MATSHIKALLAEHTSPSVLATTAMLEGASQICTLAACVQGQAAAYRALLLKSDMDPSSDLARKTSPLHTVIDAADKAASDLIHACRQFATCGSNWEAHMASIASAGSPSGMTGAQSFLPSPPKGANP